jgi:hypothetical protein
MDLGSESGYQGIRRQDTSLSGYREKQNTKISKPDALISLPAAGRLIPTAG